MSEEIFEIELQPGEMEILVAAAEAEGLYVEEWAKAVLMDAARRGAE